MPFGFEIEVLGDVQVNRTFMRMNESAHNLQPLWHRLLHELRMIETVQFLTEGQHGSGGWPALKESTVKAKKRKGQMPWIERATEELFKSLTEDAPGSIAEVTSDWLRYGTDVPYAKFQQTGTVHMPRRRLVQLTGEERVELTKLVQRYLVTGEI